MKTKKRKDFEEKKSKTLDNLSKKKSVKKNRQDEEKIISELSKEEQLISKTNRALIPLKEAISVPVLSLPTPEHFPRLQNQKLKRVRRRTTTR